MVFENIKEEYESQDNVSFILTKEIYSYKVYLFDAKNPKKYKPKTNSEILTDLHKFNKFLKCAYPNISHYSDIDPSHIDMYKRFCFESLKNDGRTINKKIRSLKKFFNYLRDIKQLIIINPALQVSYFKLSKEKLPKYIPKGDLKILNNILILFKYGIRDVCITKIIAYTGLKLQETFYIKIYNLDLEFKNLIVIRNGEKFKFALPDDLCVNLKEYLHLRSGFLNSALSDYLFISYTGNVYTTRSYQEHFKLAVIKADFKETYTPRNVRASFFYYMAKNTDKDKLKEMTNQNKVEHYYDITNNPLIK